MKFNEKRFIRIFAVLLFVGGYLKFISGILLNGMARQYNFGTSIDGIILMVLVLICLEKER